MKIKDYLVKKDNFKIDLNYQRPPGAWTTEDNQCLIDTILKSEPMPLFFINQIDSKNFYIVDGQQRLEAIRKFHENKFKLNKKFSGDQLHGKIFSGENSLSPDLQEIFLNYELRFHILEDYNDEKVRAIFSRLQRGKPLTLGERLNALPGNIVLLMRKIAAMEFLISCAGISNDRYNHYPDAARMLFYEKYGAKDAGTKNLYEFFDEFKDLQEEDTNFRKVMSIVNFLETCFPSTPGNYQYLTKHAWIYGVYTMINELKKNYSLTGLEKEIRTFIENFHNNIYSEDFRRSNQIYQKFFDNIRGGWSEKIIKTRRDILIEEFLKKYHPLELDEKRQVKDAVKMECYEKVNHKCEDCGYQFKDYKEPEYHHEKRYIDGGPSEIKNIKVLCSKCHTERHAKGY